MIALCQAQKKNRVCGRIRGTMNELVFAVRNTAKGLLISKFIFGIFNSSIKRTKRLDLDITAKVPILKEVTSEK